MNQEERRQRRQKDTKSAVIVCVIVVLILLVLVAGGVFLVGRLLPKGGGQNEGTDGTELPGENVAVTEEVTEQPQTEVQTDPVEEQAAQLVSQMTLEDKIAQMFVITPNALTGYASGVTAAGDTTKEAYQSRPVGGIVYMADNLTDPEQTTTMLSNMQEIARERTGLPVFLCVDEEGGSVARIAGNDAFGVTNVGNMSDIGASGDVQNAYNAGSTIGSYLAALGFNVDFAPVADVLTNPDNQVIGQRSFGSDAQTVAGMVTSELQGLSAAGVYGTVKHFPGHGGTSGDSHDGAVSTDKTLEELMAEELVPFQSAVDGGVNFVMVGHISAPNVTGDNAPATLSKVLITDVLRGQMGYNGIVITDAMNMEAVAGFYNSDKAAVLAVTAGADMILMPADYNTAYTGILNAVNDGTITEERINESVTRIVKAKLAMGQP
ncbi:MAG: glycoside hydrolase family 3 protein [Roseburia hominis]